MAQLRPGSVFGLIVALALGAGSGPARAMSVSPIQLELTSAGNASRSQVTVRNTSDRPLAVESTLQQLAIEENGNRRMTKAGDEFLVFPPQALIPPGGTQVFRVQWVGEPLLDSSQSYMLSISQTPVKFPEGKAAVQVVMSFGVVVNVAPPTGTAQLRIVGTAVTIGPDGRRQPTITVENPSKVHALLNQATIRLSGGNWSETLGTAFIQERVGIGLVQPGKRRRFILPVDLPAGVTQVQAAIDYRPKR